MYPTPSFLDLACGQGILSHHIPPSIPYVGVDLSNSLIQTAKKNKQKQQKFYVSDICKPLPLNDQLFTHAAIVLALQNVEHPERALQQASKHLVNGGTLAIVLNHPSFRIPRQTHWGEDEQKKLQYRRVDHYLTPLKIPIQMHPSQGQSSQTTWSFHHSLADYSKFLADAGFVIVLIEEWASDKKSTGKNAKMENRARSQFPLFLTLLAQKVS
ncbi:MAG: 2-methoxy-6-polyprenyl-1,4-benzoquinol methylase, mitochondrial [Chlamydiales bacterium]|nr:2-methoxy-6-polyprenyl-1,4-benzoquinol methylase, mitochondrial [Chlamydiales bacterium]